MLFLIEEHQYDAADVSAVLDGITALCNQYGKISVDYVGYYYNPTLRDCVFILPKVLMQEDNRDLIFGKYEPEKLIHLEAQNDLEPKEYEFVYELAVWIYRAIAVYRDSNPSSTIILQQQVQQMSNGRLVKSKTLLDVILALLKFNRENQNFFFFVLRNLHSGFNKINWTKTIAHTPAFLQEDNPVYVSPVNKKRQIDFEEELLIIFFSILNYIQAHYGFRVVLNFGFPLITGKMFDCYLNGLGKTRLRQIKYKYFSDKAKFLWELCYAFFDLNKKVTVEKDNREYLLVKNFNIVFEAIIDNLIGNEKMPDGLKNQSDGKQVDHMYYYQDLINNKEDIPIYYIGDSKYYKRGHVIGKESVYKQFTYARNVIQWNLDQYNDDNEEDQTDHIKLRDDITEGYNVIPNFFISAEQNNLEPDDHIKLIDHSERYSSRHFKNRLFDRDTLLIAHYDVNFLFVVALYGRKNENSKQYWRKKVRKMFRSGIQETLEKKYDFYTMTAVPGVDASVYIEQNFHQLLGKIFSFYSNTSSQRIFILALDKNSPDENSALLTQLRESFVVRGMTLEEN